jgi:hypothetical protein
MRGNVRMECAEYYKKTWRYEELEQFRLQGGRCNEKMFKVPSLHRPDTHNILKPNANTHTT